MACNDTTSNICLNPIKSTCVDFDGTLGDNTKITEECVNQHEVNEDLYDILDEVIENSSTENLALGSCLTYPLTGGVILVSSALKTHDEAICSSKARLTALEAKDYGELDITGFNLNFGCLVDPCGDPITKLGQLLQIMIDKQCT